ncbi:MAG: transporter substrate-binding domain-containing protein [Desulfovibrio sp.]|jgi:signal transduction histidine kinase/ABC-type amino acid transport substrate-binding protein/ActR/RegA family two-component response regulator|nr:transporter substrate-binding domain-containing protein [Desulfovibrio sp.]
MTGPARLDRGRETAPCAKPRGRLRTKPGNLLFSLLLPCLFFLCLYPRCGLPAQADFPFATYRNVPGLTQEEREAVERLRGSGASLVYGTPEPSTECFVKTDGTLGGYSVLLCDWLSGLFGIRFTPALYEWEELLRGLASRAVDFTGVLTPTPERRKQYLMSSPLLERVIKYFRIAGSESLSEIAKLRPVRYVFFADTTTFEQVGASLEKPFEIIYVDSYEAAYRLLKNNEADAYVDEEPYEIAFDVYDDIVLEDILPIQFCPVSFATQNPELAPILSVVQKILDNGGNNYINTLYKQGREEYINNKFLLKLTPEEREYVYRHGRYGWNLPVPFGMEYDNYPIAFYNYREHNWQGCALDVLAEIGRISGLNFVPGHNIPLAWPELVRKLESGELAVISELVRTPEREERFLWPSASFMTDFYALVSHNDYPDVSLYDVYRLSIGMPGESAQAEFFQHLFPRHNALKIYSNTLAALLAMDRGEVDLVMTTQNQLLNMTHYMEKPYYKINLAFNEQYKSTFGINKSEKILCSIISKSMRLIDVDAIAEHWRTRVFDYRNAVARERTPYILGIFVLLLGVVFLLFAMFLRSKKVGRQLEAAVAERTRALRLQTRAAERAVKTKSDFLARTSHEIRTPMNAIIGLSELAQREYGTPEALEYIRGIRNAGASLLAVINDILDFSQIDSGKLPIHPERYETASLLNDVLAVIRVRTAETSLDLLTDISSDLPAVMFGDAGRIRQILLNLLSNAVKYTNEGFIKFSAYGTPVTENTVRLTFVVEDSGIGIRQEDMPKLFGEFVRIDETRHSGIEGTGLGLAIARSLCLAMDGDVAARSEYGKGSVFTAELIQIVEDRTAVGDIGDTAKTARAESLRISFTAPEADVLIVDELPGNLMVAEGLLAPYRMRIFTCLSGREAVELVRARPFDLVLMDHMMPEMDGVEATKAFRAMDEERCRTMPVVALTANAVSGMREMFLANGFDDFLSKPVDVLKLDAVLTQWIPAGKRLPASPEQGSAS